jgi:DNA-binding MarR family transcriptional regulator
MHFANALIFSILPVNIRAMGRILILLQHKEMMTQRELADVTQRRAATLSEQLENNGALRLIIREKSTDDKRNVDVRLTDKGRRLLLMPKRQKRNCRPVYFRGLNRRKRSGFTKLFLNSVSNGRI